MRKIDKEKIEAQLDQIKKAEPSEEFLLKMEKLALQAIRPSAKISRLQIFMVAASLGLLVVANYFLLMQSADTSMLSDVYNLIPTKSIYNG